MGWSNYGHSNVRLNYDALNQALITKGQSKTGWTKYRDVLFLHGHGSRAAVTAYRHNENTIALKLYRTEIIHYHKNGLRTLYGAGWIERNTTRHWFWEAGIWIERIRPNNWSKNQYAIKSCVFYDGMQVNQGGKVISEYKSVEIRTPNAEAKVLRKKLTALGKIYRTFALLHAGSEQRFDWVNKYHTSTIAEIDPVTHEFDLDLYKQLFN